MDFRLATAVVLGGLGLCTAALADEDIGQIKTLNGEVFLTRGGVRQAAALGEHVRQADVLTTGADGAAGITFADDSRLSIGPDSELALDRFSFNSTTNVGAFDSHLMRGTMAVKSGKITRQTPEAMTVRTPTSVLGVRGTEFVVRAGNGQ